MGLARFPRITLVPARVSPMLWWRGGAVELLFPAALLDDLTDEERDALLAHELAHVRRHDHWVRFLELGAVAAFWWHPVAWWARSRLRHAEERSCDAWVVRIDRDRPRSYAKALLKTVSFLSGHQPRIPALASGVGEVQQLEERLTMILRPDSTGLLSRPRRLAFAGACLTALLIFPTWAERHQAEDPERSRAEAEYRERRLELERQAADLEVDLRAIRSRQRELEAEWMAEMHAREADRLRDQARGLEDSGQIAQAQAVWEQVEILERQAELQLERERVVRAMEAESVQLELPLQEVIREIEALEARGETEKADALRAEARVLKRELAERQVAREVSLRQMERDLRVAELQESAAQVEELRRAGRLEEAERMERELATARRKLEHEEQLVQRKEEYIKLRAHAEQLSAEGRDREAMELKRQLYEEEKRTRMKIEYKKLMVAIERLRAQERHQEADELELRLQEIRDLLEDTAR
jgi:BlaR1 peptidase M56